MKTTYNVHPIKKKIKQTLNSWLKRDLSLKGRILLCKTEGLLGLVYTTLALDVPQSVVTEMDIVVCSISSVRSDHVT